VAGATHLFEEPGALESVARLATDWFHRHLTPTARRARVLGRADHDETAARLDRMLR
jgi:hypothetical protein